MLYKKQGYPEEGELVLCTVTKVQHHSVFAKLDEYEHKSGMLHISEISPGRIRNIRDYVVEGKKIICKILKINQEKGHIDLSLRRVNENQRRTKNEEIKQEQKAEKIIEYVANEMKKSVKELYYDISKHILPKYEHIFPCFYEVVDKDLDLSKLGIEAKVAKKLSEIIKQRIKPMKVIINGKFELSSYEPDGVDIIKNALVEALKDKEGTTIKYNGAGIFALQIIADNYDIAEKILENITSYIENKLEETNSTYEFIKEESKKLK